MVSKIPLTGINHYLFVRSVYVSIEVYLSIFEYLNMSQPIYLHVSVYLLWFTIFSFLSTSIYVFIFVSLCIYAYLFVYLCISISIYVYPCYTLVYQCNPMFQAARASSVTQLIPRAGRRSVCARPNGTGFPRLPRLQRPSSLRCSPRTWTVTTNSWFVASFLRRWVIYRDGCTSFSSSVSYWWSCISFSLSSFLDSLVDYQNNCTSFPSFVIIKIVTLLHYFMWIIFHCTFR